MLYRKILGLSFHATSKICDMKKILKVSFLLLPGSNTEFGAPKVEKLKSVQDFPWSGTRQPVALNCVVSAFRRLLP